MRAVDQYVLWRLMAHLLTPLELQDLETELIDHLWFRHLVMAAASDLQAKIDA